MSRGWGRVMVAVAAELHSQPDIALTAAELSHVIKATPRAVRRAAALLVAQGVIWQEGDGSSWHPYIWSASAKAASDRRQEISGAIDYKRVTGYMPVSGWYP
jgi:hypothetical protein